MNHPFVNLLVRWLVLALGVALSTKIVPGISYDTATTLLVVVVLLSLLNVIVKPILLLFTLPFIILTLGLGIWIVNALMLYFVGHMVTGFHVATFGAAMLGSLIISVTNLVMNRLISPPKKPPGGGPPATAGKREDVIDI